MRQQERGGIKREVEDFKRGWGGRGRRPGGQRRREEREVESSRRRLKG